MVFLFRIILCIPCSSLSGPGDDDLFDIDDVLVVQLLEDFNLLDGRDREVLSLGVHADLLDCHDFLCLHLLRHEYFAWYQSQQQKTNQWGHGHTFKLEVPSSLTCTYAQKIP